MKADFSDKFECREQISPEVNYRQLTEKDDPAGGL